VEGIWILKTLVFSSLDDDGGLVLASLFGLPPEEFTEALYIALESLILELYIVELLLSL